MFNFDLMKKMKLFNNYENGEVFIQKIIKKLKELEKTNNKSDKMYIENIERLILENKIVLGSPIIKNILSKNEPVSSCTVIPIDLKKDINNLKGILEPYAVTTMGSGYDLNQVDNPCETIEKISDVIHELIQIYPNRLSAMGTLDINSEHILKFIDLKRKRNFETCHYNISVTIPDSFFEGIQEYDIIENGVKRKITNTEILKKISSSIHYCGEPGIIFKDKFNSTNPLPQKEYEYKTVAPCAEIAMSDGEVCQFSYINLGNMVNEAGIIDKEELQLTTRVLTRMLDNLCDISIQNAKSKTEIIEDKRRIGVGVCGFADMLAKLNLPYDSKEAKELSKDIFTFINFNSKVESVKIAQCRGSFRKFSQSLCANQEWYDRFKNIKSHWVSDIDWMALQKGIKKYGIRNSSTTAIPPTGRSATIVNASYSIEPYFDLYSNQTETGLNPIFDKYVKENFSELEQREIFENVLISGNCQGLDERYKNLKDIFKTAKEIDASKHIEMMATINECIDESISKTVNLPNEATEQEIGEYIIKAYKSGLNGITFFRDKCLEERKLDIENDER